MNRIIEATAAACTHRWAGLLLLLVLFVPIRWMRVPVEDSFWTDEAYSIAAAHRTVGENIDVTVIESHPPVYYIMLSFWRRMGDHLGVEKTIGFYRAPNFLLWLGMTVLLWPLGRSLLGSGGGTALAWVLCACGQASQLTKETRGYALAAFALLLCLLLLAAAHRSALRGEAPRCQGLWWAAWTFAAMVALYGHMLVSIVMFLLGLLWIGMAFGHGLRSRFAMFGAAAHAVAALSFAPMLMTVRTQVEVHRAFDWIPAPTLAMIPREFWFWYPIGQIIEPYRPEWGWVWVLGLLSFAVPLGALLASRSGGDPACEDEPLRMARWLAGAGCGVAVANVCTLWTIQKLGLANAFYEPRYPSLTAMFWALGIAGAAMVAAMRWRVMMGWLVLPWIAAGLAGVFWITREEPRRSIPALMGAFDGWAAAPREGEPLYVAPGFMSDLLPRTLEHYEVLPIEKLGTTGHRPQQATILNLSTWTYIERPEDLQRRQLYLHAAESAISRMVRELPPRYPNVLVIRLEGIDWSWLGDRLHAPLRIQAPPPESAVAHANPRAQRLLDGWSFFESTPNGETYRWSGAPHATIQLDGTVPAGEWRLVVVGYRSANPGASETFKLRSDALHLDHSALLGEGSFRLEIPVHASHALRDPRIESQHRTWIPAVDAGSESDRRTLGWLLSGCWIEPAGR